MATIKKETRDAIIAQALNEIAFARQYKQGKTTNWKKNEDMYYGRKTQPEGARANVDLGRMQEFVHTILAKIDNPLVFKFGKRKPAQLKRVNRLNALRQFDQQRDFWGIKDLAGKKQAIIYGRAIYSYFASQEEEYCPNLGNVDVYDFLIDPSAGGLFIENARYLGDYGVVLDKAQIKAGIKDGTYLKTEATDIINNPGNANESTPEEVNKKNRTYDQSVITAQKEIGDPDKYKFWRWGTTYEGERYYLLISETAGTAIRLQPLKEVFESGLWWYWTWAAFIDLTEFWTPSYCDYVREVFMAQSVSINQSLDNSEEINKPMKVINVGAIEDLSSLKYRRNGAIKVKKEFDIDKAVQFVRAPMIDTPLKLFDKLEQIQEKASGVTASAKGASDEETVGVYEGNEANTADRFGLLNKSYAFGYERFATLYENGVRENLTKKVAVDIIGADGVQIEEIGYKDIFYKKEKFAVIVEASDAETALSEAEKKTKLNFLAAQANNKVVNPKKAFEIQATVAGFSQEEIRQLLDTSDFGDAEIMSEAERDIERLLDGESFPPNEAATTAYKQRIVDYVRDNQEHITDEQFRAITEYIFELEEIIMRNMNRMANETLLKESMARPIEAVEDPNAVDPNATDISNPVIA